MNSRALASHHFVLRLALAASTLFAWIIVFDVFTQEVSIEKALAGVVALYAVGQGIIFLLTPLAGIALRYGTKRALFLGTISCSASYAALALIFFLDLPRDSVYTLIGMFVILHSIYRALYFVPYATRRSHEDSLRREIMIACMPLLAGLLLRMYPTGEGILFAMGGILSLYAALRLHGVRDTYESYEWSYDHTMRELLRARNSRAVGLYILDGFQGAALLLVWPLAVYLLVARSYLSFAVILTLTLLSTLVGRTVFRSFLRRVRVEHSPVVLASVVFSGWLLRLTAGAPMAVLLVDVYYHSSVSSRRFSIDAHVGEQRADGGVYVDEYTAVKEMALAIGRIAVCILFITIVLTSREAAAFAAVLLTAALAAAWSVIISTRLEKSLA